MNNFLNLKLADSAKKQQRGCFFAFLRFLSSREVKK